MSLFTIHVSATVIRPDDEPLEIQLAAQLDGDGVVCGLTLDSGEPVPAWAMAQIDMRDLQDDVDHQGRSRDRGWP